MTNTLDVICDRLSDRIKMLMQDKTNDRMELRTWFGSTIAASTTIDPCKYADRIVPGFVNPVVFLKTVYFPEILPTDEQAREWGWAYTYNYPPRNTDPKPEPATAIGSTYGDDLVERIRIAAADLLGEEDDGLDEVRTWLQNKLTPLPPTDAPPIVIGWLNLAVFRPNNDEVTDHETVMDVGSQVYFSLAQQFGSPAGDAIRRDSQPKPASRARSGQKRAKKR